MARDFVTEPSPSAEPLRVSSADAASVSRAAPLRVLDLFSGIGAFSLGLERAGLRTVAFCEIDPFCRRVLAKHWPEVPCYDDIRALTAARLRADGIAADVVCGGFPCQPFSTASRGRRVATDFWPEMHRLAGEVRPSLVIAENVSEAAITRAEDDLRALGYGTHRRRISAADAGADHQRNRWWLCAYADHESELPRRLHEEVGRLPKLCVGLWGAENYARAIRVPDGPADRLDQARLKSLGNTVLPVVPEVIGRAIYAARAPGTTARSAETSGLGPKGNGPVGESRGAHE